MVAWWLLFAIMGACGTWLARRYALARNLVDAPGVRRSHSVPTPRGGGVAIAIALVVAAAWLGFNGASEALLLGAFATGLVAVAAVGFVDDHRPLSPWFRLGVHAGSAALFSMALLATGATALEALAAFIACIVLTNVWNFMDGINGLAASQAAIAAGWLALSGTGDWAWLALALSAACAGFLPFNFPRARIFLGDVGSGSLGFALAATMFGLRPADPLDYLAAALVVAPFVIDSGLTLLRRVVRGERWWTAHTQHAYQVCSRRWGHTRVTIAYAMCVLAPLLALETLEAHAGEVFRPWFVGSWYTCAALLWLVLQTYGNGFVQGTLRGSSDREGRTE